MVGPAKGRNPGIAPIATSRSNIPFDDQNSQMRLTVNITECAPISINLVTSDMADKHIDHRIATKDNCSGAKMVKDQCRSSFSKRCHEELKAMGGLTTPLPIIRNQEHGNVSVEEKGRKAFIFKNLGWTKSPTQ
ncbi:hypothetical protein ACTXT7_013304 [Hymenolepis weldensis]